MVKGKNLLKKAEIELKKQNPELKAVFSFLMDAANLDNHEAMYAIGTWYLHGKYVKRDSTLAVEYFLKSVKGNNSNAYYDLAICLEKGVGTKKNKRKAFECYLNAALFGDKQSLYEVGRCYYHGIGISKNKEVGAIWLKRAKADGIVA